MTRKGESNLCGWRPLRLEGPVLQGDVEGLIGIEELTDYKLERRNKKTEILIPSGESNDKLTTKLSKRKSINTWQIDDVDVDEPSAKKAKVTKCKTKKSKNRKPQKVDLDVQSNENTICEDMENESSLNDSALKQWSILGVSTPIIKALTEQQFLQPTPIQSLCLPPAILGHRDILGAAETGSGKTLAFGIPILNGIMELKSKQVNQSSNENLNKNQVLSETETDEKSESEDEEDIENIDAHGIGCVRVIDNIKIDDSKNNVIKPLYALILTPTRELAIQIKNHLSKAAKYTDIKIAVVLGGMASVKQERILSKGPEIVIATPGRLWELIQQSNPHLGQVNSVKYLAIDETDRMLEKGHFQELQQLLEKMNVNESKWGKRQTFVFSATLTMVHDIPDYLKRKKRRSVRSKIQKLTPGQKLQKIIDLVGIKNPKIVDVTKESGTASNLTECRIACTIDYKDYYLYYFLEKHPGRTLVFCNSIGCVKRLATLFGILGCKPLPLHASMPQRQRLKNLERFQTYEDGLLIATDVAARGLDIPNVEHVIHYQVPRTSESYVHRSGRTARAQKEGITVLMMEPSEKQYYSKLCRTLGRTQDIPTFPVIDSLLIAVKQRVNIAREIDKLELRYRRENSRKGWLRKAAEEMDIVVEDEGKEDDLVLETKETAELKQHLKRKKRQLESLLSKPLFPKGFSGKYPEINAKFAINQESQKAIEVMKKHIADLPIRKKERNRKVSLSTKTTKIRSKK